MDDPLVFDRAAVLQRVDGDLELLKELIEIFLEDSPARMEALRNALDENNCDLANRNAHAVKSALGNLGAMAAHSAAFCIEKAGKEGRIEDAYGQFRNLEVEIQRFLAVVKAFLKDEGYQIS